jgi:signal transduction histidine kinase/DNA-binding response OmpR family regulator/ABC-type sugar transport system substrate-binding protein
VVLPKLKHNQPTIGVLAGWQAFAGTLDSFLAPVFEGIQTAARDLACNLMLACGIGSPRETTLGRPAWPILFPDVDFVPVGPWNTDGLIVLPPLASEAGNPYFSDLLANGFPVVFAGNRESGPAVIVDNETGITQAIAHLVEHGHQRIAFLSGHESKFQDDSGRRLSAYLDGVKKFGLADEPDLIVRGYHTELGGRQAMQQLLSSKASFTAVIASNDESAIGAIQVLQEAGFQVPKDIAVIGFDDRLEASANAPMLTTVHHPMFEMGYRSVELLLEFIHKSVSSNRLICIPTRLVVRESCGCMPGFPSKTWTMRQRSVISDQNLVQALSGAIIEKDQTLSFDEVGFICHRLVEAFHTSLVKNDPLIFHKLIQQILGQLTSKGGDIFAWQEAISILREKLTELFDVTSPSFTLLQAEDMLDQTRIAINEVSRGQYARLLVNQSNVEDRLGQMTTRFLTAKDETEVFQILSNSLKAIGIQHAAVVYYEAEGEDPVSWGSLRMPTYKAEKPKRFVCRRFPPPGLYPEDEPFKLVLLPLHIQEDLSGFVALDTSNLAPSAYVVRQLAAALRGVQLYREAIEARRLAEEANHLKSRFLSIVSHELRTPLNLISGLSDILLHESDSIGKEDVRVNQKDLERIYIGAQHLDSLIRDVLDLARSDVGQLTLSCEEIKLKEVIEDVALIGQQLAQDKELGWQCKISPDLPLIWGDSARLRQVMLNLISNAVKFTKKGKISLFAEAEDGQILITVRDTGLGIPVNEQEAIFDEFRQSERTAARGYGGLGLGLAICRRLVELHGGKIQVQSTGEEGSGSTFFFTIPVTGNREQNDVSLLASHEFTQALLLTDDSSSGRAIEAYLSQQGITAQAFPVNQTTDWLSYVVIAPPNIIILDQGLAVERGWEIVKLLKETPATQNIPIIFFNLAENGQSSSMLDLNYLTKPLGSNQLAEMLAIQGMLNEPGSKEAGKTILVVDDDFETLQLHSRMVASQLPSYRIMQALDGREALQIIQRHKPNLVVLDLMMPEIDGLTVLKVMRQDENTRNIPVVVLTGQSLTAEDMQRLNRGMATILEKGLFSGQETVEHITEVLNRKRLAGTETQRNVQKAIAYIHAHYPESISRSSIAAHVGLSERHLTRCFHQEIGITPIAYLNRYRVRQAKLLLDQREKCITEVASEVGFSTSGYFSRVFQQEMGMTPRAYLKGNCP